MVRKVMTTTTKPPPSRSLSPTTISSPVSRMKLPWFSDDPERYIDWARNLLHRFGYKSETYHHNPLWRGSRKCFWPVSMILQLGTFRSVQLTLRAELGQQQTN